MRRPPSRLLAAADANSGRASLLSADQTGLVATTIAVFDGPNGSGKDLAGSGTERAMLWPAVEQRREHAKTRGRDARALVMTCRS